MFSRVPALLGTVGASVHRSMPGLRGMASTPTTARPTWVLVVTPYAVKILAVSAAVMIWVVWRPSRVVQLLVGLDQVLLAVHENHMTSVVFRPALAPAWPATCGAGHQTEEASAWRRNNAGC